MGRDGSPLLTGFCRGGDYGKTVSVPRSKPESVSISSTEDNGRAWPTSDTSRHFSSVHTQGGMTS